MSPNIQLLLTKYLHYGHLIRNYSKLTIASYENSFKVFFKDTKVSTLDQLNKEMLEEWFFNGRLNRKWSSTTFRHYHKHLNCFIKWLIKEKHLTTNPLDGMEKPRMEYKLPRTLTAEEATLVLETAYHMRYRYKFEKYRNRAVIAIMLFAGLRKQEVINLKLNDVCLDTKSIFVRQGKGAKDRIIPISATLYNHLIDYMRDRDRLGFDTTHLLVSIGKDAPFGVKGINNLIFKLRQKTKLNFSAHTLRHAFARLMLEGGCDIYTLSKIMGHSKITTTTIYLSCSNLQMMKSIEMHALN